ncbi:hypothetical protein D9613_012906 [Agrocybe pediades]|uniref:Integrase catalytic domain-containing protein n=1 Tax=Agrocybe pediades TaxID=84607 RepID=A0A8H4QQL6_9AGAR|nr:hypothetical protein D9613_012906 [Agrocybe pediades]
MASVPSAEGRAQNQGEVDSVQLLFLHCGSVLQEARFIRESLPNAERSAVERVLRQLHSVHKILDELEDPWISTAEIQGLVDLLLEVAGPLQIWLEQPPENPQPPMRANEHGTGRPRFVLDLDRAIELHDMDLSWGQIADAMGIGRTTLHRHLKLAGRSSARRPFTEITDEDLDLLISDISRHHPLTGSVVVRGHLEASGVHVPLVRVQESLRRVDEIGVNLRWNGTVRRRVYKVRGSNALWHQDGNEKLRPWGFYVHGCVDGHSRLIIYLKCSNSKKAKVVEGYFMAAVRIYGWPSRARGDFGTENNGIERQMVNHWGTTHRAYLRGRSIHNVRIERLWRDVRRDTLEFFRTLFLHLESIGLLDMENPIQRICLFLTYQHRIQISLDSTVASWNLHKVRTAGNKSPVALYQISREQAINRGYWTGDPGDDIRDVGDDYGRDLHESFPPADELAEDPSEPSYTQMTPEEERQAGIFVDDDEEIRDARELLKDIDFEEDDGNFGIDIYCEAVTRLTALVSGEANSEDI